MSKPAKKPTATAAKIRQLLAARGMTQKQLSYVTKRPLPTIESWCWGRALPPHQALTDLRHAFQMNQREYVSFVSTVHFDVLRNWERRQDRREA